MKMSVLGIGSWGTALALALHNSGHEVTLHSDYKNRADEIREKGESPRLPGIKIPKGISISDNFEELQTASLIVFAMPSFGVRAAASKAKGFVQKTSVLVSASKGIEPQTSLRMSQVIEGELGGYDRVAALSGPSHAVEVSRNMPTGLVAASDSFETAKFVQDAFMSDCLRVYTGRDIIGVELCAALKNIIAIAVGICDGLGFGDNTKAMLMTRGLNEMAVLGETLGGKRETFSGLAGAGDLFVTCTSRHSRNRLAGYYIGGGMSSKQAIAKVGATVEGYFATTAAMELAEKCGVEMPIARELYEVLYNNKNPLEATSDLMNRTKKDEHA